MNNITMKMQADELIRMALQEDIQVRMFPQMQLCAAQLKEV